MKKFWTFYIWVIIARDANSRMNLVELLSYFVVNYFFFCFILWENIGIALIFLNSSYNYELFNDVKYYYLNTLLQLIMFFKLNS